MANPIVDGLVAESSNALERWFDRWTTAVQSARNGDYSFEQFAADVTETWIDSAYVSVLPLTDLAFNVLDVTKTTQIPIVRFFLQDTSDATRVVAIPNLGAVNNVAAQNLQDVAQANQIPSGNVTLVKGSTHLSVTLTNLAALNIPPGFYSGNIIGQPMNAAIARVEVVFPG